jgi:hypothetical protein
MSNGEVKRIIKIINRWNIEEIEVFYLFLKCYWKFWDMYIKAAAYGSRHFPYKETIMEQLKLRGFDEYFEEFKRLCRVHDLKGEKIDMVINYIENKYKNELEDLVRKRLESLTYERKYLEYLVDWCCSRNEFAINFDDFTDYMPKDETEGLRFLFRTGLLMLGGYTSLGSRDKVYHHDQCFVPLWVRPILQEIFKELSEVPEDIEKELERIEEERKVRDVCPICNRKVFYGEKWTKVFGRVFHASCFKNRTGLLRPADERSLGEMFKKLEIISGEYLWEVPVGEERYAHPYLGRRRVDLVIRTEDEDWIIEIERILNYEAIGQVTVYEKLWKERNPYRKVRRGIICFTASKDLLDVAKKENIEVFCYV